MSAASGSGVTAGSGVTVVIAAFNAQAHVGAAVRSALAQEPAPAEVIVVDDFSSDDTAATARAAGARVIQQATNQGPGAARAVGVAAANTPWIAILDADDVYLPGHLARMLAASTGHVLIAGTGIGSASGRWYGWAGRRPLPLRRPSDLLPENPIMTSSTMMSRVALQAVGGFASGRFSEDLETWIVLLEAGSGVVVPEPGVIYREHSGQATAKPQMVGSAETVFAGFTDRAWFSPRQIAALAVVRAWDTDRRSVLAHARAWPALLRCLINRRRAAHRRIAPPGIA